MRWRPTLLVPAALMLACTSAGVKVDLSVAPIEDVNSTSATHGQDLHPNDYQGSVSAWYFGHAT
jgi:hypothetical protein